VGLSDALNSNRELSVELATLLMLWQVQPDFKAPAVDRSRSAVRTGAHLSAKPPARRMQSPKNLGKS
jgi:hypothetical protein